MASTLSRLNQIQHRREQLVARAATQRNDMAEMFSQLRTPLQLADKSISFIRFITAHPLIPAVMLAGVVAVLIATRRFNLIKWAERGFVAWRMYRSFKRFSDKSAG